MEVELDTGKYLPSTKTHLFRYVLTATSCRRGELGEIRYAPRDSVRSKAKYAFNGADVICHVRRQRLEAR